MRKPVPQPEPPLTPPGTTEVRGYEPPRITGKRALESVTLVSGGRPNPGGPGWIGHP
jgi:hypothetical protein